MLASLKINNVALIEKLEINFGSNLNVISGETGSGKSILLNALGFVIGERLDKTMLRTGTELMKVDAIFIDINSEVCSKIENILNIQIENNEVFVTREYSSTGKTICKINNELVTTSMLKQISAMLLDIHGQHQHQSLLDKDFQLDILDKFCGKELFDKLVILNEYIDKVNLINSDLSLLGGDAVQKQNLIDLYSYQIEEIERSNIKENELEELEEKLKEMKDSEKISSNLNQTLELTDRNAYSQSAIEQIALASKNLAAIANNYEKYEKVFKRLESLKLELADINEELSTCLNNLTFDQNEFDKTDERIDFIKSIFRKYGGSYENFINYKNEITLKLDNLINSEEKFNILTKEKEDVVSKIVDLQKDISTIRKEKANILQLKIEKELQDLGMPNAKFNILFEKTNEIYTRKGNDEIEFMFSANIGFEPKPLNKVASGGELSRFMLAYKIVVNEIDDIGTLIFDEIDTGISGNIANVVANCMGKLSRNKQLIVVSHLPQICAMADDNYLVEKISKDTTITTIKELNNETVYPEIARLMGLIDAEGLMYAKKLKTDATSYKKNL